MTENNGVLNGQEREPLENQSNSGLKEVLEATPKPAADASSEERYTTAKQFIANNMKNMPPALRELAAKTEVTKHFGLNVNTIKEILSSLFPKGQSHTEDIESPLFAYPGDILIKANEILETGDPWKFIQDTYQKYHVGDETVGELCACSFAATHLTNSQGLPIKPSGSSGKGKSHALDDFAELIPTHKVYRGSMSGMAAFYSDNLQPGMVFLLDDTDLNRAEGLRNTIKRATTNFQQKTKHKTVFKGKGSEVEIPERCTWLISSVSGVDDDQTGNRFIPIDVDTSPNQDIKVHEWQTNNHLFGTLPNNDEDVHICRAMYDILGLELYDIRIPFINCIDWNNKENRRNWPMFIDIVMGVTFHYIKQREKIGDTYLVTVEDCEKAISIYKVIAERNATKLTEEELEIMRWWDKPEQRNRAIERKEIASVFKMAPTSAINLLHGRDGKGGLLTKVPGISFEKAPHSNKILYYYDGSFGIGSYSNVVSLDYRRIDEETEAFRALLTTGESLTQLTQHSHNQCASDKSTSIDSINSINNTLTHKIEKIEYNNNLSDLVISPSETNNYVFMSGQKVCKPALDIENVCVSDVQVCDSVLNDAEDLDVQKVLSACMDWEKLNRPINGMNYRDVSMYCITTNNLPSEMLDDITRIVKKYAKIPDSLSLLDDCF